MRTWILAVLLVLPLSLSALQIRTLTVTGNEDSDTNTILHFFQEYSPDRDWKPEELNAALARFQERLVRVGWFRDVEVTQIPEGGFADVTVSLTERMPYTFTVGNLYAGVTKYNLWGMGKSVRFEIGPVRQKITLEDPMILFSRAGYGLTLGQEEYVYYTTVTNTYAANTSVRQMIQAAISYGFLPDFTLSVFSHNFWIKATNGSSLGSSYRVGLKAEYDRRSGFPSIRQGYDFSCQFAWLIERGSWQAEAAALFYIPIGRDFVIACKGHAGLSGLELPEQFQYSLRNSDGLRTLSQFPGMTGNQCWDAHLEFRWNFWEVIPFLIFDMQLEALAFVETGEARACLAELGSPHFVYGAGLRIYLDTIGIRVEAGFDERGETSILTSFSLPY